MHTRRLRRGKGRTYHIVGARATTLRDPDEKTWAQQGFNLSQTVKRVASHCASLLDNFSFERPLLTTHLRQTTRVQFFLRYRVSITSLAARVGVQF